MVQTAGYTTTAKSLHWLIVALLVAQFIFAWTMPHIGRNTPVTTLISLHFTFGIVILAVAIVRLFWRATHAEPAPLDGVPPWQVQSARVLPIVMFGAELPKLIGTRAPGWGWTGDVHDLVANYVMLTLVGLHVVAGLYHYFIRRDGVLQRMLPGG
jgi:cytochrome b561